MDTYKVEQRNKRKFLFKYLFIKKGKKEKKKKSNLKYLQFSLKTITEWDINSSNRK